MPALFDTFRKASFILLPVTALFALTATALLSYFVSGFNFYIGYYSWRLRLYEQYNGTVVTAADADAARRIVDAEKGYYQQTLPLVIALGFTFLWSAVLFLLAQSPQGQFVPPITSGLAKPKVARTVLGPLGTLAGSAVFFVFVLGATAGNTGKDQMPCTGDAAGTQTCQILNAGYALSWLTVATLLSLVVLAGLAVLNTPRSLGGLAKDEKLKAHDDYQQSYGQRGTGI
ncbi:hypothetical protein V8E36_008952 [Tilletia maclaganii]